MDVVIRGKHFRRRAGVFDSDNNMIISVVLNLYHSDCFKWDILKERGWTVHTLGFESASYEIVNEADRSLRYHGRKY